MEETSIMAEVFTGLGEFITGIFTAIGQGLTAISGNELLLMFVILIPLFGLAMAWIFSFVSKPRNRD